MFAAIVERRAALAGRQAAKSARSIATTPACRSYGARPSTSRPEREAVDVHNQELIDQLWERVARTPSAVMTPGQAETGPRDERPPRSFKGTRSRARRGQGQTPQEAASINSILSNILQDLENPLGIPAPRSGTRAPFGSDGPPAGLRPFRETESSPELAAEIDTLKEELEAYHTTGDVVEWAQRRLFQPYVDEMGFKSYPRTYPHMLAHVLYVLRVRLDAPQTALALFSHARALGVESYLAGCQTNTYNELLRVRWESFRDLHGVCDGIREMEVNAVAWDKHTNRLVSGIVETVGGEVLGAAGIGRWGHDVYLQLSSLEQRLAKDTSREEKRFSRHLAEKRAFRKYERQGGDFDHDHQRDFGHQRDYGYQRDYGHKRDNGHRRNRDFQHDSDF